MFGATLAARMGLPYSFASHFAPRYLSQATNYYRENYQPSEAYPEPYLIAAVNVTAADTQEDAEAQFTQVARQRVKSMAGRGLSAGRELDEAELDQLVNSPSDQQIISMLQFTAVGTGEKVREYLTEFRDLCDADELMISLQAPSGEQQDRSMEILAQTWGLSDR